MELHEINWFISYLSDHYQQVKLHNAYCAHGLVNGGVPQDRPFAISGVHKQRTIMYYSYVHEKLVQYADDTALICSDVNQDVVHQHLLKDLKHLDVWIKQSKMQLNTDKSNVRPQSLTNIPH